MLPSRVGFGGLEEAFLLLSRVSTRPIGSPPDSVSIFTSSSSLRRCLTRFSTRRSAPTLCSSGRRATGPRLHDAHEQPRSQAVQLAAGQFGPDVELVNRFNAARSTLGKRSGPCSPSDTKEPLRAVYSTTSAANASRREPVNFGVCRPFRIHITQFLHSTRLHLLHVRRDVLCTLRFKPMSTRAASIVLHAVAANCPAGWPRTLSKERESPLIRRVGVVHASPNAG